MIKFQISSFKTYAPNGFRRFNGRTLRWDKLKRILKSISGQTTKSANTNMTIAVTKSLLIVD